MREAPYAYWQTFPLAPKNNTVDHDQRQKDAERTVQLRRKRFDKHLYNGHKRRDNGDIGRMRTLSGITFLNKEITALEQIRTKVVARPYRWHCSPRY